jgi:hypothetical protein
VLRDSVSQGRVESALGGELRRAQELGSARVDEQAASVRVDPVDDSGGNQQSAPERHGRARIDHDVAASNLSSRAVDATDDAVPGLDLEAGEV